MLTVVREENEPHQSAPCAVGGSPLDELASFGVQQMQDDAHHLVVLLRADATSEIGVLVERPDTSASNECVA